MPGTIKQVVGMLHVGPLPGTPRSGPTLAVQRARACEEARQMLAAGCDALLIENMHDVPYLNSEVGPEITAAMTMLAASVRRVTSCPLGVQVLAGANHAALAVAHAADAEFIRAENFVFAHVADEGLMPEASAGPLLRTRRRLRADHIRILADIRKKHASHALTADIELVDAARAAEFCGVAGVIVTGRATGDAASIVDVAAVREAVQCEVWVGSGVTPENLPHLWPHVDGVIVGSALKRDGYWANEVDPARLEQMQATLAELR